MSQLLGFLVAVACFAVLACRPMPVHAGGKRVGDLLAHARTLESAPWPARARAYRAVLRAASAHDRAGSAALRGLVAVHRSAGHAHATLAAEAAAAWRLPKAAASRMRALRRLAKGLRTEGDDDAAAPLLAEVARRGRRLAPKEAASALAWLAEDAYLRGDAEALGSWAREAADARARPSLRMTLASWQGLLALRAGRRKEAERLRTQCRRFYEGAQDAADDFEARRAAKIWLDLPLAKALDAHPLRDR